MSQILRINMFESFFRLERFPKCVSKTISLFDLTEGIDLIRTTHKLLTTNQGSIKSKKNKLSNDMTHLNIGLLYNQFPTISKINGRR